MTRSPSEEISAALARKKKGKAWLARQLAERLERDAEDMRRYVGRWTNEGVIPEEPFRSALIEILGVRLNGAPGPRVRVTQWESEVHALRGEIAGVREIVERVELLLRASG